MHAKEILPPRNSNERRSKNSGILKILKLNKSPPPESQAAEELERLKKACLKGSDEFRHARDEIVTS